VQIGLIAPPWVPVPPPAYGGIELVLDALARGLVDRGHHVTLFTTGDSTCDVERQWLIERASTDRIGETVVEVRHAAAAYEALAGCDLIHDHTVAGLLLRRPRGGVPVVATNHGPFDQERSDIYRRAGAEVPIIAVSNDQAAKARADMPVEAVIHHGLDLDRYAYDPAGGDYLVVVGRMAPAKGVDWAIEVARRAGLGLVIAAKMREPAEREYFEQVIRPLLGVGIELVGEIDHARKVRLLGGARALLNPIQSAEPFGLVMIEAMACGTPVVSTSHGAAPELVSYGESGFVARSIGGLVVAVEDLASIDRVACRRTAERRFSMDRMAHDHEVFYEAAISRYEQRHGRTVHGHAHDPAPCASGR
jgi:glycosyltransferase involved in cell wall biosynthesis